MIAQLTGEISEICDDSLILNVQGVGYEIFLSSTSLEKLKTHQGSLSLSIYTAVREDAITLYGFLSRSVRELFVRLLRVSGIGPKLALNILSGIGSQDLIAAIHQEDLVRLTSISGIGKKTAERMIVELKDKLLDLLDQSSLKETSALKTKNQIERDVLSALLNLGYNRHEIEKTLERISFKENIAFEQALKESLQTLSKA